ncbi:MAG: hypothetical protein JSR60_08775 [Proteobacteria bacterium]|nr:hypothetical protein [Pseudomonadota bacterium]
MRKLILLSAVLAITASPAFARPGVCISHDNIRNWTAIDDKHIVIEDISHKKALLTLVGTCSGFKYTEQLVIKAPGAMGISCVDVGDQVVTHDGGMRGSCLIRSVEPYTPPAKADEHHDGDHHDGDHHE